jgi:hypothetical protein
VPPLIVGDLVNAQRDTGSGTDFQMLSTIQNEKGNSILRVR